MAKNSLEERTWQEFQDTGMIWWINTILHTFGWAITVERNKETHEIVKVYPARTIYRGFPEKVNDEGYTKVSKYLKKNIDSIMEDCDGEE